MRYLALLTFIITSLYLSACTPIKPGHSNRVCKALTDDIMFKPATSNIRRAEDANVNLPLAKRDYDIDNCNES